MTTLTSQALKSKRRPNGNQWRHGVHKDIMDNVYENMDAAFLALEQTINAGWASCAGVFDTAEDTNFSAALKVIDTSVNLVLGSRILVTGQTTPSKNGIYVLTVLGGGAANSTWARASDFNETSEVQLGDKVWVTGGTVYANTEWRVTTAPAVLGTNDLAFTLQSAGSFVPTTVFGAAHDIAVATGAGSASGVNITANSIVARLNAGSVVPVTVAASTIVGRGAAGDIDDLAPSAVRTILTPATDADALELFPASTIPPASIRGINTAAVVALADASGALLTAEGVVNGLFTAAVVDGGGRTMELPSAAALAALVAGAADGTCINFTILNNGAGAITVAVDGGATLTHLGSVGSLDVAAGTHATFRIILGAGLVVGGFYRVG